ncbi:hypothetical protein BKA69DRAFT_417299 [Paraphysoderma sedebokerense]|nr:hypothetical protein BKA69DRAFT_417299 [Paraphysoderma sedebokerense]
MYTFVSSDFNSVISRRRKVQITVYVILLAVGIPAIETATTLYRPSIDDDGLYAQRQVRSVRRLGRRGLSDLAELELVGFHGTCSNAKDSIERKIESSKHIGQLGFGGFYVADADGAAAYYAKEICVPPVRVITPTKKVQPVLCSVYMNRDYLLSLKKVYVPQYLDPNHHKVDSFKELFWDEEEIKEWEKTQGLKPKADVLRFGM